MARYVLKFGGSSVADIDCLRRVASIIQTLYADNHELVVVVSAMGGETDRLVNLIQHITPHPSDREYAACVSSGEQVSSSLLAMMLQSYGVKAQSVFGWQMQLKTDDMHRKSHIQSVDTDYFDQLLADGIMPIVTGFQGVNQHSDVTTLGRGGSDTTAVALAAFLNAAECIIYTDVQGVFSADPRIVPMAQCLPKVSYAEMLTYADLGAKVLQTRSVELARKFKVPVRVKSTFEPSEVGTLLVPGDHDHSEPIVSGIACVKNQVKVTLAQLDHLLLDQLESHIQTHDIEIDMHTQDLQGDSTDVSFTMHEDELPRLCQLTEDLHVQSHLAKISLVGQHMQSHAGFAADIIKSVSEAGVTIHSVVSSATKVSILVGADDALMIVQLLHRLFIENRMTNSTSLGNIPSN